MPRIHQGIFPHCAYHVLNRGNAKQIIFHNHFDYQSFSHLMSDEKKRYPLQILAFCLLPNHIHLCLKTTIVHGMR